MQILLDADILLWEISFAAESYWKHWHKDKGLDIPTDPPPFDICIEMIEDRVPRIVAEAGGDKNPFLFFTGTTNYRHFVAVTRPYKERNTVRPYHHKNTKAYLTSRWLHQEKPGLEADDLITISLIKDPNNRIATSRDKDVAMSNGWHYSWELGNQPSRGPFYSEGIGRLDYDTERKKVIGHGPSFFYLQTLTGDPVDSIPGLPKIGPKKAYDILSSCTTEDELYTAVSTKYREIIGENWYPYFLEQARLLYLTHEVRDDYQEVLLWNPPNTEFKEWMNVKTGTISKET